MSRHILEPAAQDIADATAKPPFLYDRWNADPDAPHVQAVRAYTEPYRHGADVLARLDGISPERQDGRIMREYISGLPSVTMELDPKSASAASGLLDGAGHTEALRPAVGHPAEVKRLVASYRAVTRPPAW